MSVQTNDDGDLVITIPKGILAGIVRDTMQDVPVKQLRQTTRANIANYVRTMLNEAETSKEVSAIGKAVTDEVTVELSGARGKVG
jgi:hypothetical protein